MCLNLSTLLAELGGRLKGNLIWAICRVVQTRITGGSGVHFTEPNAKVGWHTGAKGVALLQQGPLGLENGGLRATKQLRFRGLQMERLAT